VSRIFRRIFSIFLTALAFAGATAAHAAPGPIAVTDFVCPIGGERFAQETGYISDLTESWPDGSRPGDEKVDTIVAECPGNGFVFHPRFAYTPAQLGLAETLIASADYRALAGETRLVRLLWLAPRVGRPAGEQYILLIQASWAARNPAERAALMTRIADEGPALIAAARLTGADEFIARRTVINAQREIGRMAEAQQDHDRLAPQTFDMLKADDGHSTIGPFFDLQKLIEAGDRDRWPLQIMPAEWADAICGGARLDNVLGAWQAATSPAACTRHRQRVAATEIQKANLSTLCADLDPMNADVSLITACVTRDRPDISNAKAKFSANPGPEIARCNATIDDDRDAALSAFCTDYYWALEDRIGVLLADDEPARAILCGPESGGPDDDSLGRGCRLALEFRQDRTIRQMLEDPSTLEGRCAAKGPDADIWLVMACFNHRVRKDHALLTDLVSNPAAYDMLCGYYAPFLGDTVPLDGNAYETRCAVATEIRSNMQGLGANPQPAQRAKCVELYIVLPGEGTHFPCASAAAVAANFDESAGKDSRPLASLVRTDAEHIVAASKAQGSPMLPKDMVR